MARVHARPLLRPRGRAALLLLLALPAVALARPGGGENYGGSSSSSASSSSGSDSASSHGGSGDDWGEDSISTAFTTSDLAWSLLFSAIALYAFIDHRRGQREWQKSQGAPAPAPSVPLVDPRVADARFHSRAEELFALLNEAWFRRDLSPVRHRLSDATYQRFNTLLRIQRQQGERNATADNRLLGLRPLLYEQDAHFEAVHASLTAEARDVKAPAELDDDAARAQAREAPLERYTEIWTFLRKPGARPASLAEGTCPACGGQMVLGETAACAHCTAIVNSGRYDWILAEITQAHVAFPGEPLPPGVEALRGSDPALCRQVLEDRGSLLFWKWVEARALRQAAPLAKVAAPDFVAALAPQLGSASPLLNAAVGSVDLLDAEVNGAWHRARLSVRWSAGGQLRRSVMELQRRADAPTPAAGLATARCPACAGPLSDNGQPSCDYCGEPLAASPRDWVLAALEESPAT